LSLARYDGMVFFGSPDDFTTYFDSNGATNCDWNIGDVTTGIVRAMVFDDSIPPHLWLGTSGTLYDCDISALTYGNCNGLTYNSRDAFAGNNDNITALAYDGGSLWAGSSTKGVAVYSVTALLPDYLWDTMRPEPSKRLPSNNVTALALDPAHHYIYVGTFDAGLVRIDWVDQSVTVYTTGYGLPSNHITALALDAINEILWVGTDAGVVRALF
jgi:ligand-binding sensor domain-containing protein